MDKKKKYVGSHWKIVKDSMTSPDYLFLSMVEEERNRLTEVYFISIYVKNYKQFPSKTALLFITLLNLFLVDGENPNFEALLVKKSSNPRIVSSTGYKYVTPHITTHKHTARKEH